MNQQTQKAVVRATALITLAQQFDVFEDVLTELGDSFQEKLSSAAFAIGMEIPAEEQRSHFAKTLIAALKEDLDQIEA